MIGREIAHYRILDRLGGGGMGVVYRAEDTRLGRTVVLKFLNTELLANESVRKRFLHEARAASVIDHPNVCHVYEVGEAEDGRAFIAMTYCEGRSLRDVIKAGPAPPREAFGIAFGIAQGLWAAHRRGIVHRDIKPGNVILTDEGFVRIVDFGLALLIGDSRVTTSGVTVGTVAYMSPEQTSGSTVAANTDIWSLGVTLYELLTGRLPFRGEVNAALVYSIVHEPHTPLPDSVPQPCAQIVDRCLEKDPAKRYQTIEELLEDMVKAAHELGWESSAASATIAPILQERRRKILTRQAAIAASVVVALAGGWFAWHKFHVRSPYTTQVRLAVMPLENFTGAENEALVDGLADHITRVTRWVGRGRESMWTVTYPNVVDAGLPDLKAASASLGVNRVITGDVQRMGEEPRLRLKLQDARSGKVLREASLRLGIDVDTSLIDSLPGLLSQWFNVKSSSLPAGTPWNAGASAAVRPYLEGLSYYRRGTRDASSRDKGLASLERSVAADSSLALGTCAAGYAELQRFYRDSDRTSLMNALRNGRRARGVTPALTDASVLLGNVFRALEQSDSAEACYRYASAIDPTNIVPHERLADLCVGENRLQEAEHAYLAATTAASDCWLPYRWLGVFYYGQKRIDDAGTAWSHALDFAPNDILTLNNMGVVHYYRGEWKQAQTLFLRAFKTQPDCNSCTNVGTALFLDGKYAEAASYFELALSPEYCDSTNYVILGNLASALYWVEASRPRSLATYRRAIAIAEKQLASKSDSADLIAQLVDYYAMSGDSVRAREMINRAEPFLQKNSYVMYRVGSAYEKLGNRGLAMNNLANAVRHGYQLSMIRSDPVLRDLVNDKIFLNMISTDDAVEGARTANHNDEGKAP